KVMNSWSPSITGALVSAAGNGNVHSLWPSAARYARSSRSPATISQPARQSGAETGAGTSSCHLTAPLVSSSALTRPGDGTNSKWAPVAGVAVGEIGAFHFTSPVSSDRATNGGSPPLTSNSASVATSVNGPLLPIDCRQLNAYGGGPGVGVGVGVGCPRAGVA